MVTLQGLNYAASQKVSVEVNTPNFCFCFVSFAFLVILYNFILQKFQYAKCNMQSAKQ